MQHKNYVYDAKSFTTNRRSGFWASARAINITFVLPGIFTIYSSAKEEGSSALPASRVPAWSKMLYWLAWGWLQFYEMEMYLSTYLTSHFSIRKHAALTGNGIWGKKQNCSHAKKSAMSTAVLSQQSTPVQNTGRPFCATGATSGTPSYSGNHTVQWVLQGQNSGQRPTDTHSFPTAWA